MNRVQRSQLKDILLRLTTIKNELKDVYWAIGEDTPVTKCIAISAAMDKISDAILSLLEGIG